MEHSVYVALREDIVQGRLVPDLALPLADLSERFGVSSTPVRHALRRLEAEGLVEMVQRRGARVAGLSADEIEETQLIRLGVEGYVARLGASRCTREVVAEMEQRRAEMLTEYERGDLRAYVSTFWPFRDPCYRRANRPRLLAVISQQRLHVDRYLLLLCQDPRTLSGLEEYQNRFLEVCRACDGEGAEAITREGVLWVLHTVQLLLEKRGEHAL